ARSRLPIPAAASYRHACVSSFRTSRAWAACPKQNVPCIPWQPSLSPSPSRKPSHAGEPASPLYGAHRSPPRKAASPIARAAEDRRRWRACLSAMNPRADEGPQPPPTSHLMRSADANETSVDQRCGAARRRRLGLGLGWWAGVQSLSRSVPAPEPPAFRI
ncbi:hypothetical protein BD309DRAFT_563001, partial [Dichomitus squalens]